MELLGQGEALAVGAGGVFEVTLESLGEGRDALAAPFSEIISIERSMAAHVSPHSNHRYCHIHIVERSTVVIASTSRLADSLT
jgi:hypothetical protein